MTKEEALQLRTENQELREALKQTQEQLRVALARIARTGKAENAAASICQSEQENAARG
jgi:hypothetical protein